MSHLPERSVLAFGVGTAAYQIEGSTSADGRGPSIWDTFAARPGAIADASDGSIACGSYERLDEDLRLLEQLGVDLYRFSIAWSRVQPDGRGAIQPRGLAYYDRLVDGLLARGIRPFATLYHWDLPQALEDAGGWPDRDTALRFAEYAALVHDRLGDRVNLWTTVNEPWCVAFEGYASGVHAPGRREPEAAFRAAHHLLLAHGLAKQRLDGATAGIVLNLVPVWPERAAATRVARQVDAIANRLWLDPLLDGHHCADAVKLAPSLATDELVRDGDLALIHGSLDWLGINYYAPTRVDRAAPDAPYDPSRDAFPRVDDLAFRPREPRTAMGWEIDAHGLEQVLIDVARRAPALPLIVSENGAAFDDHERDAAGSVVDADRIDYLASHMAALVRARDAGVDVRAYVVWTLLDNFEWAEGYRGKFGLVEVERGSLRRIPKASFHWYADLLGSRGDER